MTIYESQIVHFSIFLFLLFDAFVLAVYLILKMSKPEFHQKITC
jgi:hypothetical protein